MTQMSGPKSLNDIDVQIVEHALRFGVIDRDKQFTFIERQAWNLLQLVAPLSVWQNDQNGPGQTQWCAGSRMAMANETWDFYKDKLEIWLLEYRK